MPYCDSGTCNAWMAAHRLRRVTAPLPNRTHGPAGTVPAEDGAVLRDGVATPDGAAASARIVQHPSAGDSGHVVVRDLAELLA